MNLGLLELGAWHLHLWKVSSFLYFWSHLETKAKDFLCALLKRWWARTCKVASSFYERQNLRSLNCKECEQISSLVLPICMDKYFLFCSSLRIPGTFQTPLRPPLLPSSASASYTSIRCTSIYVKNKSSIFSFCHSKQKKFSFPLLYLPLYPNLGTLQGLSGTYPPALQSSEQAYVDEVNLCHWWISPAKLHQNYMWK